MADSSSYTTYTVWGNAETERYGKVRYKTQSAKTPSEAMAEAIAKCHVAAGNYYWVTSSNDEAFRFSVQRRTAITAEHE